jgi:opacity protein-like surface antigen
MKKTIVILAVVLLVSTAAVAAVGPIEGKKFEFSAGLGFTVHKYTYDDGWKETYTVIQTPLRIGFFLWKGLEFEPELLLASERYKEYDDTGALKYSDHETGYILSGNVLYNFKMKSPRMIPFVLAGYGFGNGDLEGIDIDQWDVNTKTTLLNLGAGVKYLFGNIAAFRFEYRFRGGQIKETDDTLVYITKVQYHQVLFGLSLFF